MIQSTWLTDVINLLEGHIFSSELKRLRKNEIELVHRNQKLSGRMDGFWYKGALYSDLDPMLKQRGTKGSLHPSLLEAVENHFRDEAEVSFDRVRVKQALALILRDCRTFQDIRDALPNSLKDVIPMVAKLERTREEAYTVKNDPRAYKQYLKLRDKIEFYNAAKLLY